eukprot:TRINITY_DN13748_c0_g1_i1.p3 TRINITY_DN13748_c0_g1~~TRINITY_DN13748_c0_g1_i1.p3  ORF type:complete len:206 (-),score=26.10 TRINITY_DN13748_c0_g1_i1:178-795(-)
MDFINQSYYVGSFRLSLRLIQCIFFFFFKQKTAYEMQRGLVGSEMCIRDSLVFLLLQECRTKTRICDPQPASFKLLETMYWSKKQKYPLLEEHCSRLTASARYFCYPFHKQTLVQGLTDLAATFTDSRYKIRVTLQKNGDLQYQYELLPPPVKDSIVTVALAQEPVDRHNHFLYHKTTNRTLYEQASAACPEADDVLLYLSLIHI